MSRLRDEIKKYTDKNPARFHMPGHKGKLCPEDITELDFSDDLHNPKGGISEIEKMCAAAYSAEKAFLLVNGSTGGICAFCIALALKKKRRPRILVSRDCHKSFISGAFFADALVCGVFPEDVFSGCVTAETVKNALDTLSELPDAVFITSPNYYGMCADTEAIYNVVHERGVMLFTDAAHGAHFPFSAELPPLPHADVFTVSTHKTLCAYNQTGILLCNCDMQDELRTALSMMQTTSPSYPLMLSIEHGIRTANRYTEHVQRIRKVRDSLIQNGVKLAEKPSSAKYSDVTRLCIMCENGYALNEKLISRGIYTEMADLYSVVLITTPDDDDSWYDRLISAACDMRSAQPDFERHILFSANNTAEYTSVRCAMMGDTKPFAISDSLGRVCARAVGIYPPGIATLFPGETVTAEKAKALENALSLGGKLFGTVDDKLLCLTDIK